MATLALDAGAGKLADLLGVDLRDTPKTKKAPKAIRAACRCAAPDGSHDPRVWASAPGLCEKCGHWLADEVGRAYAGADLDGVASLAEAIEDVRCGLLDEAADDGVLDEDDYLHWLETRLAATERDLDRMAGRAKR